MRNTSRPKVLKRFPKLLMAMSLTILTLFYVHTISGIEYCDCDDRFFIDLAGDCPAEDYSCPTHPTMPWCMAINVGCCQNDNPDCPLVEDENEYWWKDWYSQCVCKGQNCAEISFNCGTSNAALACVDCNSMSCWEEEGTLIQGSWYNCD